MKDKLTPADKNFIHDMRKLFYKKYTGLIKEDELKEIWANAVDEYRATNKNPRLFAYKKADALIEQFMGRR